jgi:endoglucanase
MEEVEQRRERLPRKSRAANRYSQGPAPEFVHLDDIDGLVSLCAGLMRKNLPWTDAWRKQRARLRRNAMRYRRHL